MWPASTGRTASLRRPRGWGLRSAGALLAMAAGCSPPSGQPGPDVLEVTDRLDADSPDGLPPDGTDDREHSDEDRAADDASTEDIATDAPPDDVLTCADPVWPGWSGLVDAGDGCQVVLAEPAGSVCQILPDVLAGDGGFMAFVPGEAAPPALLLLRVDCGSYIEVEPDDCGHRALRISYPWLGYTCTWHPDELAEPPPGTGNWVNAVRLYNIATAERRQFHYVRFSPLVDAVPEMRALQIAWPWIATEDCRNGPGWCGIVLINAETGEERVISELYDGTDESPMIDDNFVVFDRRTDGFGWNPWIFDITAATAAPILMDTIDEWATQVDNGWVIWVDQRNDPTGSAFSPRSPDLYGWEIATRTERPLVVALGGQVQPVLQDGWLFWSDYRNDTVDPSGSWGSTNSDAFARTMPDGPEIQLTRFPDTREWAIDKDGSWVYVFRAPADHCHGTYEPPAHLLRCPLP
jgi:hypothetical protein